MVKETMTKNSDTFLEALNNYGQLGITENSDAYMFESIRYEQFSNSASNLGKGLLFINHNGELTLDQMTFTGNFFMEGDEDEPSQERCLLFCVEQLMGAVIVSNSAVSGVKGVYTDIEYLDSLGINIAKIESRLIGPTDGTLWRMMGFSNSKNSFSSITLNTVTFSDIVFTSDSTSPDHSMSPLLYLP